jgi:hypothetical protein
VGGDVRYCAACGQTLDVDVFEELIAADGRALKDYLPIARGSLLMDWIHGLIPAFLAGQVVGSFSESIRAGMLAMLAVNIAVPVIAGRLRSRKHRRIVAANATLWEMPTCFRPSIPKP